jgi:type I restriction enzyme S subunit
VPPKIEEQLLVAQYISDNLENYNHLITKSEAVINLMQERRTALISAAVTGKIDVRNWAAPEPSNTNNKEDAA